ncbi:MAG TPA: hypothetical protein VGW38_24270 [Chloroflexota bacterium]|nr:hypothetical protein [Chloroflexota bacterium]
MTTSDARNHKRRVNRHVDEKMAHYRMSMAFASAVAILEAAADGLEPPPPPSPAEQDAQAWEAFDQAHAAARQEVMAEDLVRELRRTARQRSSPKNQA